MSATADPQRRAAGGDAGGGAPAGVLSVTGVEAAVRAVEAALDALDAVRAGAGRTGPHRPGPGNAHGGDPGVHRNASTLVRHAVDHLVAARAAAGALPAGPALDPDLPVVDVGAGTGAFSPLLVRVPHGLGRPLHLVEADAGHRALAGAARRALGAEAVHARTADAPTGAVVTALEVVEHLAPPDQPGFVADLAALVAPGGVLVLSTPDESGYPGGWSGYAPHTGPLDAAGLRAVTSAGTGGWPVRVLRVDGPTFTLTRGGALAQAAANRAWTTARRALPPLEPLAVAAVQRATRRRTARVPPEGSWSVAEVVGALAPDRSSGTGLLAVAVRPR